MREINGDSTFIEYVLHRTQVSQVTKRVCQTNLCMFWDLLEFCYQDFSCSKAVLDPRSEGEEMLRGTEFPSLASHSLYILGASFHKEEGIWCRTAVLPRVV